MLIRTIAVLFTIVTAVSALTYTVNDDGVNYRPGPGSQYPPFGTVNKGQNINVLRRSGDWIMDDLWGGRAGIWIHAA
ncbi:hypothetical protein BGW39_010287, partial [Mortierella sp. 14UC]